MKRLDLSGRRFERLAVVERAPNQGKKTAWKCVCDCGERVAVQSYFLPAGVTRSCGCLHREVSSGIYSEINARLGRTQHGMTRTREYNSWANMHARCSNQQHNRWHRYGGRGIRVCDRWDDFSSFLADVGQRPVGTSLDRYPNNDGNYEPGNVRWATPKEQAANK